MTFSLTFPSFPWPKLKHLFWQYIHVSGFMKTVWNYWTCALSGRFFLQSRRYKNQKKVCAFFLPLPVYLPFIALLSLPFAHLKGLKKPLKLPVSEIKVQLNSRPKRAFFFSFSFPPFSCFCPFKGPKKA